MPNSYVEITSNGSASQALAFSFPYLNQTDIGVTVDGVTQTLTTHWSFATTQSIVFGSHPANGAVIRISRTTPSATRVVDFQDGSVLSEADLDNSADQIFFIAQEAADTAAQSIILDTDGKWEAQSKPIKNVTNPTNAQDAVTKNYLENTWLSTSDKTQLNNLNTTNLNTVAGSVSNVNTVAGAITNVNTVAGKATEIGLLGTSDAVSDMNVLGTAGIVQDLNLLGTTANVAAMAELGTSTNVTNMATLGASGVVGNIATVAGVASTMSAAATNATNAASSASAASGSASAAANSAAAAAASFDTFDDRYLGSKSSEPSVDNDGNALVSGSLFFDSAVGSMKVYDGGNWILATSAGAASLLDYEFTATAGQTTFTGSDNNSATLSYTAGNVIVSLNGIILDNGSDYTATSGTSIVLASGAAVGDHLAVVAFKSFTAADAVSATNGGTFGGGVTVSSGNLLVGTTDTTLYNNTTGTGTKLGGDGRLDVARQADTVATFNRTGSSDGEIIRVVSSGTTIGAIGSVSGDIALTSTTNPIRFSINNSEKIRFGSAGQLGIGGANYGTSGQVLTSAGSGASPSWADAGGAFAATTVTITAHTTLTTAQNGNLIRVTASGERVIYLPAAATGLFYVFSNESAHSMYIKPNGTDTINGTSGYILLAAGADGIMSCGTAGTNWSSVGITRSMVIHKATTIYNEATDNGTRLTGTYTTALNTSMLICVGSATAGSAGGSSGQNYTSGGGGGQSYAEKFIASPAASYAYEICAGGAGNPDSGFDKTTTVAGMTCTRGPDSAASSWNSANSSGRAGSTATGGDVNFTGGSGSSRVSNSYTGGGGGAATRAGNGGDANNQYGGGTGGNDATSSAVGAAATARDSNTYAITNSTSETYLAGVVGNNGGHNNVGNGAGPKTVVNFGSVNFTIADHERLGSDSGYSYNAGGGSRGANTGGYPAKGNGGYVTFVEFI